MRFSIAIFVTFLAQSTASENPSRTVRGANADMKKMRQLLSEDGCYENTDCLDNYICALPDGDCNSGTIEGECYEIRASRTRSLKAVRIQQS